MAGRGEWDGPLDHRVECESQDRRLAELAAQPAQWRFARQLGYFCGRAPEQHRRPAERSAFWREQGGLGRAGKPRHVAVQRRRILRRVFEGFLGQSAAPGVDLRGWTGKRGGEFPDRWWWRRDALLD